MIWNNCTGMVILKMNKRNVKKILFIVEGQIDEPNYIDQVQSILFPDYKIKYFVYNTSIHDLIEQVFEGDQIDEAIDIRRALRTKETDPERREILKEKFTDIFMIFDMEPHYQKQYFSAIQKMLEFYSDSEKKGKLFINYPMMQSIKHISKMPDLDFKDRKVTLEQIQHYKELVGKQSDYTDIRSYTYEVLLSICAHHLMKVNYILNGLYALPEVEEFLKTDYVSLFKLEVDNWMQEQRVDVLNTSALWALEYQPELYLRCMKQHRDTFCF